MTAPNYAPGPYTTLDVGNIHSQFNAFVVDSTGRKIGVAWGPLEQKVWTAALFAASWDLLKYVRVWASCGDATAQAIIDKIDGNPDDPFDVDADRMLVKSLTGQ